MMSLKEVKKLSKMGNLLDEIIDWAIANRYTKSAFVRGYSYNFGEFPEWVSKAEKLGFIIRKGNRQQ